MERRLLPLWHLHLEHVQRHRNQPVVPNDPYEVDESRFADADLVLLADGIITSQVKEIAEMKMLIADIEASGEQGDAALPPVTAELTPELRREAEEAVGPEAARMEPVTGE